MGKASSDRELVDQGELKGAREGSKALDQTRSSDRLDWTKSAYRLNIRNYLMRGIPSRDRALLQKGRYPAEVGGDYAPRGSCEKPSATEARKIVALRGRTRHAFGKGRE